MESVDLKNKSVQELKALAYDQIALIEMCQKNLQAIHQQLGLKQQEDKKKEK